MRWTSPLAATAALALAGCAQPPTTGAAPPAPVPASTSVAARPAELVSPLGGDTRWDAKTCQQITPWKWEGYNDKPVPTCLGPNRFWFPAHYYYNQMGPESRNYGAVLILQWPDLQPLPPGVDFADTRETNLRAVRVDLVYIDKIQIEELIPRLLHFRGGNAPEDPANFEHRVRQPSRFDLTPYYVDMAQLEAYFRIRGYPADEQNLLRNADDWYVAYDAQGRPLTYITCDHHSDPEGVFIDGRDIRDAPVGNIAQCTHVFVIPELKVEVSLGYVRALLPEWQRFEDRVRELLTQYREP